MLYKQNSNFITMENETVYYNCELGKLEISASGSHITEILFVKDESLPQAEIGRAPYSPVLKICIEQLDDYFAGKLTKFSFPFQQHGTQFQQKVWNELSLIPFGKTISYMDLSKKLGDVKAIRAAASANGRNSMAIVVPCHRVIGSNGALVGYAGELWRKQWLLNHEAKLAHGVQSLFK